MESRDLQSNRSLRNERGQASSEYIAIVVPVVITLLSGIKFFDTSAKCKFDLAYSQIFVGYQVPEKCLDLIREGDAEETEELTFEPLPFAELFEPPAPVIPPVPQAPIPPGTDPVRHHIGDGQCSAAFCGGNLVNEGTRFDKSFTIDTEAVQDAGIEFIRISFLAEGITFLPSNTGVGNSVQLNGQTLGTIVNGFNEFLVPTSELLGTNVLSIISAGIPQGDGQQFDDFEFFDLSVTFV